VHRVRRRERVPVGVVLERAESPGSLAVARAMPADGRLEHTLDRIRGRVARGHAQRRVGESSISGHARQDHRRGECRHEHARPSQRLEQLRDAVGTGALISRHRVTHCRIERDGGDEQRTADDPPSRGGRHERLRSCGHRGEGARRNHDPRCESEAGTHRHPLWRCRNGRATARCHGPVSSAG
jgi:hypothetical protein